MRKHLIRFALVLLGLLAVLAIGFLVWAGTPARPMPEVFEQVPRLKEAGHGARWWAFMPPESTPQVGLILYPGGRVDARAYAPLAQAIAEQGFLVVVVRMPLNLAVFDPDAAMKVMTAYPEIKHWAVGGHSLGGAMAARFVAAHPGIVEGLVLWAAYPAASDDLSRLRVRVVSIAGSRDGLATPEKIQASAALLPADTIWVVIEGGNHAQFGWYGDQAGDLPPTLSRQQQQEEIVRATVSLLEQLR